MQCSPGMWGFGSGSGGEFGIDPESLKGGVFKRPTRIGLSNRVKVPLLHIEEQDTTPPPPPGSTTGPSGFGAFMQSFKGGGKKRSRSTLSADVAACGGAGCDASAGTEPSRVVQAVAGDSMSWFLVEEEGDLGQEVHLYGVGSGEYGAAGFITEDPEVAPRRMEVPSGVTPMAVTCGRFHAAILFDDSIVRCAGSGQQGQLGRSSVLPDSGGKTLSTEVLPVEGLPPVSSVRSGWAHTLALSAEGELFGWGSSISFQLGETQCQQNVAGRIAGIPPAVRIRTFDCGLFHSVAVTEENEVLVWGTNSHGQLGVPRAQRRAIPSPSVANVPPGETWVDVQCGLGHTTLLSEDGNVYTAGSNAEGQLGRSNGSPSTFCKVEGLEKVERISSSSDYVLAVAGNTLWGWGTSSDYQLGTGERLDHYEPVRLIQASCIGHVSAGWTHSFACVDC